MTSATEPRKASFNGLRVGSLESRMGAEMTRLIENLGGTPVVAPSMREVPLEEHKEARAFGKRLRSGEIDMVIFFTGVGTRTLFKALTIEAPIETWVESLKKTIIVTRGPKPVRALSEVGLAPAITVPEPNTWREILKTLDAQKNIRGLRVAVQEYGESNKIFIAELLERGADVMTVPVYRAQLPEDLDPLRALIDRVISSAIDILLFTNATQAEHLMAVARAEGKAQDLRRALRSTVVASVGPSCSAMLHALGLPVDIEPERPMMGALVATAAERGPALVAGKRIVSVGTIAPGPVSTRLTDPLHQSLFMKACRREKTDRTPVWLMRQAGRYMKEYRELRAKVSFIDLCKNSDLASEVTVDAAHRLKVDAAIIFSDILLLVEPLGFELSYGLPGREAGRDQGPRIGNPFRSAADLKRLRPVAADDSMSFVMEAIRKTRRALKPDIPLIGFAGAPFTMASYMIEGGSSRNFLETKKLMTSDPKAWGGLMDAITNASIDYLNAQIEAGAQAIQIFDSWVGCLSPEDFRTHAFSHIKKLVKGLTPGTPVIYFGTQTNGLLPVLRELGADVIGVDWRIELDEAWEALGNVAIQGNFDPAALFSTPKDIRDRARRILNQAGGRPGHIFNLGHGILPETPIENVHALIEAVREMSSGRK